MCFLTLFALPASAQYVVSNLVSNTSTFSPVQIDQNLVDGWGLASFPNSPFWVSDQNTSSSMLYTGSGSKVPLVVQIPCVVNGAVTVPCPFPGEGILFQPNLGPPGLNFFGPTGIVANTFASAGDFTISGTNAPACSFGTRSMG